LDMDTDVPERLRSVVRAAWDTLGLFHRSSSLAESLHSWLRPYLQIHRGMPGWLLPLLQLFWNHHMFERGGCTFAGRSVGSVVLPMCKGGPYDLQPVNGGYILVITHILLSVQTWRCVPVSGRQIWKCRTTSDRDEQTFG
jgi:hypothetical protein